MAHTKGAGFQGNLAADLKEFTVAELSEATGHWHKVALIGEGGFGQVFRAMVRLTPVAIKVMDEAGLQGVEEFNNEMHMLSSLSHPHIVELIGYCSQGTTHCLVYELMANGSVDDRLACKDGDIALSWDARIRICAQLASAIHYLHSQSPSPIVHRDIKPANVFLDSNLDAKLGDVGLAATEGASQPGTNQVVGNLTGGDRAVVGDWGYLAPEYMQDGRFRTATDIYALGLTILQILTGAQSTQGLLARCQTALESCQVMEVLDKQAGRWHEVTAERALKLALWCCSEKPADRPKAEVVANDLQSLAQRCRAISGM